MNKLMEARSVVIFVILRDSTPDQTVKVQGVKIGQKVLL